MRRSTLAAVAAALLLASSGNLEAQGPNAPPVGTQGAVTQQLTYDGKAQDQNACWGYGGGYGYSRGYGGWGGGYGGYYGGYQPYYSSYSYSPYYYSYPSYGYSSYYYPSYGSYYGGGYYGGYGYGNYGYGGYGYGGYGYGGYYPSRGYSWGPCNGSATVVFERDGPQGANPPQTTTAAQPQPLPFGFQGAPQQQQQAPAINSQPVAPRQTVPLQGRFVSLTDANQPAENGQTRDVPLVFVPQR